MDPKQLKVFRKEQIRPGETVVDWFGGYVGKAMGSGDDKQFNGCLILTDQRVVFRGGSFLARRMEEIGLEKVSSIERHSILAVHRLKIFTSGNVLDVACFAKQDVERFYKSMQGLIDAPQNPSGQAVGSGDGSLAARLKELQDLKDQALITDAEYSSLRSEALAR